MSQLRLYNTLTRRLQPFVPQEPGKVKMYHCGPTVYQRPHIGNYRAFLFADLLRRTFEASGLEVLQVMNLTDVGHLVGDADEGEDKLDAQARKEKVDPWQIVATVSEQFFQDLEALQIRPAHHYPKATDHIEEMVAQIEVLLEKGHAYRVGDNVYFDVHSFPDYGRLSGNKVADLEAGARVEVNQEKRHPADFALWKSDPRHLMKWKTVFGEHGFPGWHIECSAMSMKYLGDSFDLHTGGEDNVFPHHECEIAQAEGVSGKTFVNLWMHTKFLQVDGGKMSKSLGNVYSLDDLEQRGFEVLDFRFLVLRAHYRASVNFTWKALQGAAEARKNLHDFRGRLQAQLRGPAMQAEAGEHSGPARKAFWDALHDDLNTSAALAALFELRNAYTQKGMEATEAADALDLLNLADDIFGLFDQESADSGDLPDPEIDALVEERNQARRNRDFARSDQIRDQLAAAGIVLEDGPEGTLWHRA